MRDLIALLLIVLARRATRNGDVFDAMDGPERSQRRWSRQAPPAWPRATGFVLVPLVFYGAIALVLVARMI